MQQIYNPVVMAGGIGSRLFPISRALNLRHCKQLIYNDQDHTILQKTFTWSSNLSLGKSQLISNHDHRFFAKEICRRAHKDTKIILRPVGRNTFPAIILAALRLLKCRDDI